MYYRLKRVSDYFINSDAAFDLQQLTISDSKRGLCRIRQFNISPQCSRSTVKYLFELPKTHFKIFNLPQHTIKM